jgi:hypothetical protein
MLAYADRRGVMAVVMCDAEVANWNHYVACILLAFLFLPLGYAQGSPGNVHSPYGSCLGKGNCYGSRVTFSEIVVLVHESRSAK